MSFQTIENYRHDSKDVEQGFTDLTTNIGIFQKEWKESIDDHKLYRYINTKLSQGLKEYKKEMMRYVPLSILCNTTDASCFSLRVKVNDASIVHAHPADLG